MQEKKKNIKIPSKARPTTPSMPVSRPNASVKKTPAKKADQDYNHQVGHWIGLFQNLNKAIQDIYSMCSQEGFGSFTEGVMNTLQHSLEEFTLLRESQSKDLSVEISDPTDSVDGELLRQYIEDGYQPPEALVLLIRERAEEETEDDDVTWEDSSCSFDSEVQRSHSLSRMESVSKVEEKFLGREKPSPEELKQKHDDRMKRAEWKKSMMDTQRQEVALERRKKLKKAKEDIKQQELDKRNAIQLEINLKQNKADQRYEAHLSEIKNRAKTENLKADEIAFILEHQTEHKKMNIDRKIEETRKRRKDLLQVVKKKQEGRVQREEAAVKRRKAIQKEKGNKLVSAQQKQELAENRRHKILEEKKSKAEELGKPHKQRKSFTRPKKKILEENEEWESESSSSIDDENQLLAYKHWDSENNPEFRVTFSRKKGRFQRKKVEDHGFHWCSVCNSVLELNEDLNDHIRNEKHQTELARDLVQGNISDPVIVLNSLEELKQQRELYVKKRMKKVKQVAASRGIKHNNLSLKGRDITGFNKTRLQKLSLDFEKSVSNVMDYIAADNVLRDTIKLLDQRKEADLHMIRQLKFLPCIGEILKKIWSCPRHEVKYILKLLEVLTRFLTIFSGLSDNRTYMIVTNRMIPLADLVCWLLAKPPKMVVELTYLPQLFHLLTTHLKHRLATEYRHFRDYYVEYLLNCGLLPKLNQKLRLLQGPQDLSSNNYSLLLLKCVAFLESLTSFPGWGIGDKPAFEVSVYLTENFIYIFKVTEMVGIPYLLLCMLHDKGPVKSQAAPPVIPQTLLAVSILSMRFLNNLARLHLPLFQEMLSSDEYFDQMYHLFNYILRYCTEHLDSGPEDVRELLHEVILLIGYFATLNPKNQEMTNRGETSILQLLCNLPFAYFTDKKYTNVLFPTLISICYENPRNLSILHQEINASLLVNYMTQQCSLYPEKDSQEEEEKKEDISRSKRSLSISSSGSSSKSILAAASFKLIFPNRFPRHLWTGAIQYLQQE